MIEKGSNVDLNEKEMEKLVKSVRAKTDQSSEKEISINKFLKKCFKIINPIISSPKFWRILQVSETPIKSELSDSNEVRSTDIIVPAKNRKENYSQMGSKKLSIFAEAFPILRVFLSYCIITLITRVSVNDRHPLKGQSV